MTHEIISFSNNELPEHFTSETAQRLAHEYFRLRGSDGVMIGAWHRDKSHIHLHVAASGLKYRTGTSFRLSKEKLLELKVSFQEFHAQELGLTKSICEHGKGKPFVKDREWYALHKDERNLQKEQISQVIKTCLALAGSKRQFYELLRDRNLHYYERNGVPAGIEVDEGKFRFSRFDIDNGRLINLPDGYSEERQTMDEINNIRTAELKDAQTRGL